MFYTHPPFPPRHHGHCRSPGAVQPQRGHEHSRHHGDALHAGGHDDARRPGFDGYDGFRWASHAHRHHAHRHGGDPMGGDGGDFRGPGFRDHGGGPHGGGRRGGGARALGHGDLKLLLLALIEQQPRHGYELIRTITDMFGGTYTPSPGSIYPTLTLLEDMQLVASEAGTRKRYSIAEAGLEFLAQNRELVDAVMARTQSSARMAARMSIPEAVRESTQQLRQALASTEGWSEAETQRVAEIVSRAANEIAQGRAL